jgi:hypothetical protein
MPSEGELQRLEIAPERDALAELPQSVLVDRLDAEKDVGDAELLPELEHFLVAKQHVAARFQIEVLADALAGDRLANRKTVLVLDEGDIVDDEHPRLADGGEILDHPFRADRPIAAAIERPGAAERAIPRASARELNRCAGVQDADEIFAAMAHEIARRPHLVEMLDEGRSWPLAVGSDGAGHLGDGAAVARNRLKQLDDAGLALTLEHAIDGTLAVHQDGPPGE